MQRRLLIAIVATLCILMFIGLLPVHGEAEIYDSVIRLHVLANSDSEEDQAVKLKVRDALLEVTVPLLENCTDRDLAEEIIKENMETLRAVAEQTVRESGSNDAVTIHLSRETYPRKNYESFCFPGGEYLSLRVCIGEAEGRNWWCCLFPPLCLGAATADKDDAEESFVSVGFTPSQYKVITQSEKPVYKVRFKLLELLFGR